MQGRNIVFIVLSVSIIANVFFLYKGADTGTTIAHLSDQMEYQKEQMRDMESLVSALTVKSTKSEVLNAAENAQLDVIEKDGGEVYIGHVLFLFAEGKAPSVIPDRVRADCARAYWIPFDAELYVPESEATIEMRAFEKRLIPLSVVESLSPQYFSTEQMQAYDPGNVRVFIRGLEKDIYIDRFGWIRQGENYGKASAVEIENKLSISCGKREA